MRDPHSSVLMGEIYKRIGSIIALFGLLSFVSPVVAGGVTVTLTPNSGSSTNPDVVVKWVRSSATTYVTGTTIVLTISPNLTTVVSSTAALDIDSNGSADTDFTSSSTAAGVTTITWTVVTTTNSVSTFYATTTDFLYPAGAQNYSVALLTSNPVDFGAALFYANGGNQVTVSATVPASLDFSIRNPADTANTNVCALGTLSTSATSTCGYRLRIGTNAANGFTTQVQANQDLGSGSATLTNVNDDGSQPSAGTEAYGITYFVAAQTGGRNTTTGNFTNAAYEATSTGFGFSTDPTPVPTTTAKNILTYGAAFQTGLAPSTTSTSLVEHAASISAGTPAGAYSQVLTYTVTGSF